MTRKSAKAISMDPNSAPPVIGRYYWVPCVWSDRFRGIYRWLPVIGPNHEDAEFISFHWRHWHYDWRFFPVRLFRSLERQYFPSAILMSKVETSDKYSNDPKATELRMRQCRRPAMDFPSHFEGKTVPLVVAAEKAFASAVLKCGMICPHRGMPLGGMVPDADGNVVCPGHGLKWNLATGKLVTRFPKDAQCPPNS